MKLRLPKTSLLAALLLTLATTSVQAQQQRWAASLGVGSGLTLGSGSNAQTALRRTPIHVDAAFRSWSSPGFTAMYGASLRLEVDGRVSVGLAPEVGVQVPLGSIELRPYVAVPFVIAPFSLLGAELGVAARVPSQGAWGCLISLGAGGYFWGSDLPGKQAIGSINLRVAIEFAGAGAGYEAPEAAEDPQGSDSEAEDRAPERTEPSWLPPFEPEPDEEDAEGAEGAEGSEDSEEAEPSSSSPDDNESPPAGETNAEADGAAAEEPAAPNPDAAAEPAESSDA